MICRILLWKLDINPWGFQRKLLFLRGLLGTGALFCIFKALTILPIATATVIQYIYPTFTVISAFFITALTMPRVSTPGCLKKFLSSAERNELITFFGTSSKGKKSLF